ncbi:MAG: glycosyltransferase [Verrucomicrobiota bacterium]
MPKVAVVIPSYNHAAYIGSALESVAAQTLAPERVVVVDDGSTDRSLEVIRAFADAHAGARLVLLPQANAGAHVALNRAIAEAGEADYVAILNSDDLYEPARLERCAAFLDAHPERDAVCTGLRMIDASGALLPPDHPKARRLRTIWADPARDPAEWLGVSNFTKTTSNFFLRTAYARAHPFRDYRYVHDYFFAVAAAVEGRLGVIPEPLLRYRTHTTNTIKVDGTAKVARETVRLNFDLLRELAPRLAASAEVRAAYTRYFRTLSGNAADFRVEVFLALAARLAADRPEALRGWLDALDPADFPELAAPPCPETRRAMDQAQRDKRSRWLALGRFLGFLPHG